MPLYPLIRRSGSLFLFPQSPPATAPSRGSLGKSSSFKPATRLLPYGRGLPLPGVKSVLVSPEERPRVLPEPTIPYIDKEAFI